MKTPENQDFYVGYRPVPPALKRWLRRVVVTLAIFMIVVGGVVAVAQRDVGDGVWSVDEVTTVEGQLSQSPYPMVRTTSTPAQRILLIGQGKIVADGLVALDGKQVTVRGDWLKRGTIQLMELADESSPVQSKSGSNEVTAQPTSVTSTPIKLVGEIIDPKCYTGAMKPGDGKTHKACAALCLRGGIPPVFISGSDQPAYVLTTAGGKAILNDDLKIVLAVVGDRVELTGRPYSLDDLQFLDVDLSNIRRLTP